MGRAVAVVGNNASRVTPPEASASPWRFPAGSTL